MQRSWLRIGFGAMVILAIAVPASGQTYELVWADEFDGTSLDLTKWQPQIGTGCPTLCGWGNNELQYYRSQNATVGGGMLTITAKQESFGGMAYTSARLRTKNLGDWMRGRFEMRAKLPIGQGLWPAFWMLPSSEAYGGWAASGEIDIMEYLGHQPNRAFGTLHYGGTFPDNAFTSNAYTLPSGDFHNTFHTFALEWDECEMRWYIDGVQYQSQNSWYSANGPYPAPFDQLFHLVLNVAVGGNLPGPPNGTTVFPQSMVVDYVRVYQIQPNLNSCFRLFDGMEHGNPFGNGWFWFRGAANGGIAPNFVDLPPAQGCAAVLASSWTSGGATGYFGGFGRTNPLDLTGFTHLTMWLNPDPGQQYTLEINLQDDDNGDNTIPPAPNGADDEFQYAFTVGGAGSDAVAGAGWQRVSIPLSAFVDDNSYHYGGNGILDPTPTSAGGNGRLINVVMTIVSPTGSNVGFRTDRWGFTRRTAWVSGQVWDDSNANGVPNGGEVGLDGVTVELVDLELNAVVDTRVTINGGYYLFNALLGGPHVVRVDTNSLPASATPTFDPDGTQTLHEFEVALQCDQALASRNFGYSVPVAVPFAVEGRSGLRQNVPNPFNPSTRIGFETVRDGLVNLTIYDVSGRIVRSLVHESRAAGLHHVQWDGRDDQGRLVPSGLYQYRMRTDAGEWVKRMVFLK